MITVILSTVINTQVYLIRVSSSIRPHRVRVSSCIMMLTNACACPDPGTCHLGARHFFSLRKRILLASNDTIHNRHDPSTTERYLVPAPSIPRSDDKKLACSACPSPSCEVGILRRLVGIETGLILLAIIHPQHIILHPGSVCRHV